MPLEPTEEAPVSAPLHLWTITLAACRRSDGGELQFAHTGGAIAAADLVTADAYATEEAGRRFPAEEGWAKREGRATLVIPDLVLEVAAGYFAAAKAAAKAAAELATAGEPA
jgi:hypothetical protein